MKTLYNYFETNLAKNWIYRSESSVNALIFFIKKKDGNFKLYIDYCSLNKITIKNRYLLFLIKETLNRFSRAQIFTKLDFKDTYNRIRIYKKNEWKIAFRTKYSHYKYLIMFFGLTNAPITFQAYINKTFRGLLDINYIIYINNILIFSISPE